MRTCEDRVAETKSVGLLERHRENAAVAEADHLNADGPAGRAQDLAEVAHRGGRPSRFDKQSTKFHDFADEPQRVDSRDEIDVLLKVEGHGRSGRLSRRSI